MYGRLQIILRLGAGKILDLQHGAHRQAHHGRHAGRPLRELSQKVVSGRLRRLCAVNASFLVEKPVAVLGKEIVARAKRLPSIWSRSSGSQINKSTRGGSKNPNDAQKMNGSTEGGPSADEGVTLRENS